MWLKFGTLSVAFQEISSFLFLGLWLFVLFRLGAASLLLMVVMELGNVVVVFVVLVVVFFRVSVPAGAGAVHGVGAGAFCLSDGGSCGPCCGRRGAACVIRLAFRPSTAIGRHSRCAVGTCLCFLTLREFLVGLGEQVQAVCGGAWRVVSADVSRISILIRGN